MGGSALELGPFLQRLEERLAGHTGEQLRAMLLEYAARLPAAKREGFLDAFARPSAVSGDAGGDTLIDDVAAFVSDIKGGVYTDGWGFDVEYGEYRGFGDESWTIELDGLAERAGMALLSGDAATAREAYGKLLPSLQEDEGVPGAGAPEELADTDMDEAKHRYLRAVWESEPVVTRAAAVVDAIKQATYIGGRARLATLEVTRREPLPDVDWVLPELIEILREVPAGFGFGVQARDLLAEATQRHRGVDGLADLARTPGPNQAQAYRDWVDALIRAESREDAQVAAAEAVDRLAPHGATIAAVAERLAFLAEARGDDQAALAGRQTAWRADPTRARLLTLVDVATALQQRTAVIAAEAEQAGNEPLAGRPALGAAVLLLAGRDEDAVGLLEARSLDADSHPAAVVVPFLLTGASNAHHDRRWFDTLLHDLLDRANRLGWRYGHSEPDGDLPEDLRRAVSSHTNAAPSERYRAIPRDQLTLSSLLTDELNRRQPTTDERERWLRIARDRVDSTIEAVVGGKHRSDYARVAHIAAASAEALQLAGRPNDARGYLDELHAHYPRHTSFRRELRNIAPQSPLLE